MGISSRGENANAPKCRSEIIVLHQGVGYPSISLTYSLRHLHSQLDILEGRIPFSLDTSPFGTEEVFKNQPEPRFIKLVVRQD